MRGGKMKRAICDRCSGSGLVDNGKETIPCPVCHGKCYIEVEMRREVKPARLPRFPRSAICPQCGRGGEGDTTVCSYVDAGMPEDSPRFIGCGYCGYDGPAPDHPLYPRDGRHN